MRPRWRADNATASAGHREGTDTGRVLVVERYAPTAYLFYWGPTACQTGRPEHRVAVRPKRHRPSNGAPPMGSRSGKLYAIRTSAPGRIAGSRFRLAKPTGRPHRPADAGGSPVGGRSLVEKRKVPIVDFQAQGRQGRAVDPTTIAAPNRFRIPTSGSIPSSVSAAVSRPRPRRRLSLSTVTSSTISPIPGVPFTPPTRT